MANIKVTPEELESQGEALVGFSQNIADILGDVDKKVAEIDNGWDGLAQDGYIDMYLEMKKSLDEFPKLVNALGEATKAAAKAFSSVDEELRNGFKAN